MPLIYLVYHVSPTTVNIPHVISVDCLLIRFLNQSMLHFYFRFPGPPFLLSFNCSHDLGSCVLDRFVYGGKVMALEWRGATPDTDHHAAASDPGASCRPSLDVKMKVHLVVLMKTSHKPSQTRAASSCCSSVFKAAPFGCQ